MAAPGQEDEVKVEEPTVQDEPGPEPSEVPDVTEDVPMEGGKKKKKKGGKRKLNDYFKLMLKAKRSNAPSFVYNGTTYHGRKNGHLGMVYSKSKSKSASASKSSKKRRKSKRKPKKSRRKSKRKSKRKSRKKGRKSRRKRKR